MPSPFPGMDPFLESSRLFPGLHTSLIAYLCESLQARLPSPYFADIGRRQWVEVSERSIGPGVNILRAKEEPRNGARSLPQGIAISPGMRTMPIVVNVPHDGMHEPFIDICTLEGGEQVVTNLEVLTINNKIPGEHGRDLYQRKQREVLSGRVNLVEIDLLRAGTHTTAVPEDFLREQAGPFDYHVCVHRFDNLEDYFVYPILLANRLPEIAIPLLPEHGSVTVDLQAIFDRCYDTGPYRRRVRYAEDAIEPPLNAENAVWANRVLREKGLIPPAQLS